MLRHADPARDAARCAEIYAPSVEGFASFEVTPPTVADFADRIRWTSEAYPWIVAERDAVVAGYAYATRHRARPAYRWSAEVSVYVDPAYQGRGVGRELYVALFDLLRRQRFHIAFAGIALPNPASVALHEAVGFEPIGTFHEVGWKAGGWRDVGWWQLLLDPTSPHGEPADPLPPQRLAT